MSCFKNPNMSRKPEGRLAHPGHRCASDSMVRRSRAQLKKTVAKSTTTEAQRCVSLRWATYQSFYRTGSSHVFDSSVLPLVFDLKRQRLAALFSRYPNFVHKDHKEPAFERAALPVHPLVSKRCNVQVRGVQWSPQAFWYMISLSTFITNYERYILKN